MQKSALALSALAAVTIAGFTAAPAQAQATRTWVSGVGEDTNPCSRTAPCKTFAGAIGKTAAGGEINCLDPGGFGAVTIMKTMYINCVYTEGGSLVGGNAVVVNAAATDVVVLRGLDIFGVNPPTNGVRFIAGAALHIIDCHIRRFNNVDSQGISFQPSGASELYVSNTYIAENGNQTTGGGILIQPTRFGSANVVLSNVSIINNSNVGLLLNGTGSEAPGSIKVTVEDSVVSGNTAQGVAAFSPANGAPVDVTIRNTTITGNGHAGLFAQGATASGRGSAILRFGGSNISNNAAGVLAYSQGVVRSLGGNFVDANGSGNGPFTIINPE